MPRRQRLVTLGSAASLVLGFLLLAYSAGSGIENAFFQWSGRRQVETLVLAQSSPAGGVDARRQPVRPAPGEPLATLDIPSVGLSVVILEGSDDRTLKRGPGHVEDTAYPGQLGNVVIAAHRDTHFRPLRHIQKNDAIDLKTPAGTVRYYVDSTDIIEATRLDILDPTPDAMLTLFTCYPFDFVGSAPRRFMVRAHLAPPTNKPKEAGHANH